MVNHLIQVYYVDGKSEGEAIIAQWYGKLLWRSKLGLCDFCVFGFASFNGSLSYITSQHFEAGRAVGEWESTILIQGSTYCGCHTRRSCLLDQYANALVSVLRTRSESCRLRRCLSPKICNSVAVEIIFGVIVVHRGLVVGSRQSEFSPGPVTSSNTVLYALPLDETAISSIIYGVILGYVVK